MPRYKQMPADPDQLVLYSRSLDETLPIDSDVRVFGDVMDCLDYSGIIGVSSGVGCPPYPPKVMAKILGYAYSEGIRSSRRIEEALRVDLRFMWLAGGLKPDHNTLARFRRERWEHLKKLLVDSGRVCAEAGLVYLRAASTDGTKVEAAASRKRVYGKKRIERELAAVEKILQEAEEVDRAEEEAYGKGSGNAVPERLRDAKERKAKLAEIAERLKESGKSLVVDGEPECRMMKTSGGLRPAYNLQMSVDVESQVILAMDVSQSENDHELLPKMAEGLESNIGLKPDVLLADTGYSDEKTLQWLDESDHEALMPSQEQPQESKRNDLFASKCFFPAQDKDALICPAGRELAFKGEYKCGSGVYRSYAATGCKSCSFRSECVGKARGGRRINVSVVAKRRIRMKEKLQSEEGRRLYQKRQETSEPVFGGIKENMGLRRFLLRGLTGAIAESALAGLAHNIMKCATSAEARRNLGITRRYGCGLPAASDLFASFSSGWAVA